MSYSLAILSAINALVFIPFYAHARRVCRLLKARYPQMFAALGRPWYRRDFQGSFLSYLRLVLQTPPNLPPDVQVLLPGARAITLVYLLTFGALVATGALLLASGTLFTEFPFPLLPPLLSH